VVGDRRSDHGGMAEVVAAASSGSVPIGGDPVGDRAIDAVRELREELIPSAFAGARPEVLVTGDTAEELDYHDTVDAWLPRVLAFVLGLSFASRSAGGRDGWRFCLRSAGAVE
jgi:hypothetical protein